jgi:peroxiredoxin
VALYNLYGQGLPVFHPESDLDTYVLVDSLLMKQYAHMDLVQQLHAQVSEALRKQQVEKKGPGLQSGEFAPDFVSSRPDGSQVALREFRGSWVLLSFWASWSPGSRMENPYLAKAWLSHKEEKFMIIQVGIEEDPARWTQAIRQDDLGWVQASDLRGWNTPAADLYQLDRIPANFLIDPEGRIQARDLFGEDLVTHLNQLF